MQTAYRANCKNFLPKITPQVERKTKIKVNVEKSHKSACVSPMQKKKKNYFNFSSENHVRLFNIYFAK